MLLPGDWVTGDGYGSAEKKSENLVILTGDPELNSDNSHCGPYIKNDGLIEDGTLVDELYIYLDPAELAQAEKFILTSGLNNKSDAYADEFAVMFQKDGEAIKVSAGVAPGFAGSLTEAGMYTLRYTFSLANDAVLGCFSVLKGDEEVASTGNVVMPTAAPDDTKGRRYLWFCDISVADGWLFTAIRMPTTPPLMRRLPRLRRLTLRIMRTFLPSRRPLRLSSAARMPLSRMPLTQWRRPSRTPLPR